MSGAPCAAVGIVVYGLSSNNELLTSTVTGGSVRAPKGTGARLAGCRAFRTLDEHAHLFDSAARATAAAHTAPDGDGRSPVRGALERLRAHGLLVDFDAFVAWLRRSGESVERTSADATGTSTAALRLTAFTVPTGNRPALLERNLCGFLGHARAYDRRLKVIVADQSRQAADRERNRSVLRTQAAEYGHDPFYIGPDQVASYIQALSRHLEVDPAALTFALGDPLRIGFAAGANRNALLLASIGELALSVDDDVVCRVGALRQGQADGDGVAFAGSADLDWWSFPTRDAVLDAVPPQAWDAFAQAESVLGSPVADCLRRSGPAAVHVDRLEASALHGARGAVVRAAVYGISGDAGTPAGRRAALVLEGAARARLAADDDTYRRAALGREVHHIARRTTIYAAPQCMAGALALDRRIDAVPFPPVGAGEDGIFALVLRIACRTAFLAALPCSFLHAPDQPRVVDDTFLERSAATPSLAEVLEVCLTMSRPDPFAADPARRLRRLGEGLSDLAGLPAPEFWQLVRRERWRRTSADLARFDSLLARYQRRPAAWARDVDRYGTAARTGAAGEGFYTPRDLLDGRTPAEARTCAQEIVRRYAALLTAWPDVARAASELRQRGSSLETPA